ncbi:hypothetical protein HID58_055158 [Brassica napus]|uniref:Uncharacterized protein n=1 Tax=Brassica napus TaxID=3708 RepID=A0ABQ8AJN2_BRANA|nr:hypothetical protein HID58_055158 [Brassica napus]
MKFVMLQKLERKKNELRLMEEKVQELERIRTLYRYVFFFFRSPEKISFACYPDKQLHTLTDQLAAKQAQVEGIVVCGEDNVEGNAARNRFKRTNLVRGFGSDHEVEAHSYLPYSTATRNETQPRLMYLRSDILALHNVKYERP